MDGCMQAIKQELRRRTHQPIPVQGKWLNRVVTGYFNYHAVPTNSRALAAFRYCVTELHASPQYTQGGSRMRESRLYGSVRGGAPK
jgi:hypothetical protein